jgi:hypothetical protein
LVRLLDQRWTVDATIAAVPNFARLGGVRREKFNALVHVVAKQPTSAPAVVYPAARGI